MVALLALDLATSCGFAAGDPGCTPRAWSFRLSSTGEDVGAFLDEFWKALADECARLSPSLIIFEAPILWRGKTSLATARKLTGLANVTEIVTRRLEIKCREAQGPAVTKFFTGRASYPGPDRAARKKAKKRAVLDKCRRLGWQAGNDDEADALALWAWGEHCYWPEAREIAPLFVRNAA